LIGLTIFAAAEVPPQAQKAATTFRRLAERHRRTSSRYC
jgi:hypothetical protein